MSEERWRPVLGFDRYAVSDLGRVRGPRRVLKQLLSRGYPCVNLHRDGDQHRRNVHRLVAEAFHGPCPDGMQCRHLNGVQTDNRAENLQWGTPHDDHLDQVRHGTHNNASKTHCKHRHPLSGQNLIPDKRGRRQCRTCKNRRDRRYHERKSA